MSAEPPIHAVKVKMPREYHSVRVFMPDGSKCAALWTGKVWWGYGEEVFPTHWQEMDFMRVGLEDDDQQ